METIVRHRDEGEATWFLNSLVTSKATARETGGTYGISDHLVAAASNPPPHAHTDEEQDREGRRSKFYSCRGRSRSHGRCPHPLRVSSGAWCRPHRFA